MSCVRCQSYVAYEVIRAHTAVKGGGGGGGGSCAVLAKTLASQSLKISKIYAFKSKVKTVSEKLSFILRIWPENFLMDILRDPQLVIFAPNTIFITFFYKSLARFLFKLRIRSSRLRRPEVALDFCVWPLCDPCHVMFLAIFSVSSSYIILLTLFSLKSLKSKMQLKLKDTKNWKKFSFRLFHLLIVCLEWMSVFIIVGPNWRYLKQYYINLFYLGELLHG